MSRNTVILLVVLCAGIAGLIIFSKMRSSQGTTPLQPVARESTAPTESGSVGRSAVASPFKATKPVPPANPAPVATSIPTSAPAMASIPHATPGSSNAPALVRAPVTNADVEVKPLPVLEKEYAATTNRDERLDLMMDIAEVSSPESVKALTRLFEVETDPDLKVDLLDSLLGIEGFNDEKLIMLTMGARQGLPSDVRQSAIDGLIDLDDQRVIPILNGLLNDPDAEIREAAKDALELVQSQAQPTVILK